MLIDDDCLIIEDCDGFAGKTITGQQYVKVNHKLIEKALAGAGRVCYNALSENAINVLLNSSAVNRNDVYPATSNDWSVGVGITAELVYKNRVLVDTDFSKDERKILCLLVNRAVLSLRIPLVKNMIVCGSSFCIMRMCTWYNVFIVVKVKSGRKMKFKIPGTVICSAENISKLSDLLWTNGYFIGEIDSDEDSDEESLHGRMSVYRRDLRARTQNDYKTIRKVIDEVLSKGNT